MSENLESYRSKLAAEINSKPSLQEKRFVLNNAKQTEEYKMQKEAKIASRKKVDVAAANKIREAMGLPAELQDSGIEKYNSEFLPFESVDGTPREINWGDFDQDDSGEAVYLYRGLDNMDTNLATGVAHKSRTASNNETPEVIFARYKTTNVKDIASISTQFNQGNSPVLHTTRNRNLAESLGKNGVVVTFKIPKEWLIKENLKKSNQRPLFGNEGGEQELDFFYELPDKFVDKVEQRGQDIQIHKLKTPEVNDGGDDVISIDLNEIPPPPVDTG